jgi:hypothetical protein
MTRDAQKHLASAKRLIASGELYYHKAVKEILAAQKSDPGLGYREIGEYFGKGKDWPRRLVQWHTSGARASGAPVDWESGDRDVTGAKAILREATPTQLIELVRSDPRIEKKVVQAAAKIAQQQDAELRQRVDAKERKIHGDASQDRVQKHEREIGFLDDIHSARSRVLYLVKKLHDLELSDEIAEECAELFDDMRAAAEMGIAFLDKGERFDDELAELLAEGQ